MLKSTLLLFAIITLFSCQQERETIEVIKEVLVEQPIQPIDKFDYKELEGIYRGEFGDGTISIILSYVSDSKAIGYNIHKGLQRNLNGHVFSSGDSIQIKLNEPGDHEYDGVFTLTKSKNNELVSANWTCNDEKIKSKKFELNKIQVAKKTDSKTYVVNMSNIEYLNDTIGDYHFRKDGMVVFKYYPETDNSERVEQFVEIKGNWTENNNNLIIEWENNNLFKNKKEVFTIKNTEEYEFRLENDDRIIESMYPY